MGVLILIIIIFFVLKKKGIIKFGKSVNFPSVNDSKYVENEILPYYKKKYLLTKAEKNFYNVLEKAICDEDFYICPKVRLADIIYISGTKNRQKYFNKIQSKHIDFLLCSKQYLNPVLAIELDDSSHNRTDRIDRDRFVDNALKSAGLPIFRVKVSYSYDFNFIKNTVKEMSCSYSKI